MAYKFTFKKQKQGTWDHYKAIDIKYRGTAVGYIRREQDGRWCVRFQVPASEQALAANPNCPWSWAKIKTAFDSAEDAKAWLNENRESLLPMIYFESDSPTSK